MKIIVSHDVDHLSRRDHYRDLVYPKLWVRSSITLLNRQCTFNEWRLRMSSPFEVQRHRIPELCSFDIDNNIPSTFFFAVNNGLGLAYSIEDAEKWIKYVKNQGLSVGVHGIEFDKFYQMKEEYNNFQRISHNPNFGIRMHYVRTSPNTFNYLSNCGYVYDSSVFNNNSIETEDCFFINNMIEFPITVMDSYLKGNWEKMVETTCEIISGAEHRNIRYFVLLFHDIYFSDAYSDKKKWYINTIRLLKEDGYEFVSFEDAVKEMRAIDTNV